MNIKISSKHSWVSNVWRNYYQNEDVKLFDTYVGINKNVKDKQPLPILYYISEATEDRFITNKRTYKCYYDTWICTSNNGNWIKSIYSPKKNMFVVQTKLEEYTFSS